LLRSAPAHGIDVERMAEQLLRRWGVVFRDLAMCETLGPPWRDLLLVLRRKEAQGEVRGGRFVSGGTIAPGGKLAVNTSGGGLSYNHPGMYGLLVLIEAIRQVRGECGQRQIKGCEISLAHGNGGVLSSQCTVLFGGPSTV